MLVRPRISDTAFEVATISRCWMRSFKQGFGRFVAARGDMRSELWGYSLALSGDPCGPQRVHRDTDCQQLCLLVRDRRLHHTGGLKSGIVGLAASLPVFRGRE